MVDGGWLPFKGAAYTPLSPSPLAVKYAFWLSSVSREE